MKLFETKVSFERQGEMGKKVTETYLIDALSFMEAEAIATQKALPLAFNGDLTIDACRKRNISEVIETSDVMHDRYFEARVHFITLDERSGTERKSPCTMIVQSDTLPNALACLQTELEKQLGSYEIACIKESPIGAYYVYGSED